MVVSTTPAPGSAGVATDGTFAIEFSAPLDTLAQFEHPQGFFIHLAVHPLMAVGEPDSITISDSGISMLW